MLTPSELPDPARLPRAVAIDTETFDPRLKTFGPGWPFVRALGDAAGFIVGASIAWRDDAQQIHAHYLPLRVAFGEHHPDAWAYRAWLSDLGARPDGIGVLHNAPYDFGWMQSEGITVPRQHVDTMVCAALLDEHRRSYALDAVAPDWCGPDGRKDESGLRAYAEAHRLDPKHDLWKMPVEVVAPYAEQDARLTLRLAFAMAERRRAEIPNKLWTLEHEVQRVLLDTRRQGIRIDLDHAQTAREAMRRESARLQHEMLKGARPSAARELATLFLAEEGREPTKTKTGEPSITKAWLKQQSDSTIASTLLRIRWLNKQEGTFLKGIIERTVDGRLHGELHALRSDEGGTVSGRLSSSKINLQNLTAKSDPAHIVRNCFLPELGADWVALDYSGQEARIAVHVAVELGIRDARALAMEYASNPRTDLYAALMEGTNRLLDAEHHITRDQAKVLFLAAMYGMGDAKCGSMLKVPDEVGTLILLAFRVGVPWVTALKGKIESTARVEGVVRTMLRRSARFQPVSTPFGEQVAVTRNDRRFSAHVALNRVVQGSAADQVKLALVALHREGIVPLVTVHDEIDINSEGRAAARNAAQIMADVLPMRVPMVIDIAEGQSWGAAQEVDTITGTTL